MADEQKVPELIEQAAREGRTELDLSEMLLTSLPPKVAEEGEVQFERLVSNHLMNHIRGLTDS